MLDRLDFDRRRDRHLPRLSGLFQELYGSDIETQDQFLQLLTDLEQSWSDRSETLRQLDTERELAPDWFQSNKMLGGVCYVDRFAGGLAGIRSRIPYFVELGLNYLHLMPLFAAPADKSDGGYAVSSYREVNPALGTMAELAALADELRANGISLVLDFVFNHTSHEHQWAKRAIARDPEFERFYLIYPDREQPDAYEQTTREIFPDDHPGSFVQLDDGRWIWSTFHRFQWDLNYRNPAVFRAMARELLFLANQGVEIVRMDAVAFIWKQLGTSCENLPEAHLLLQAFNAVCRIAAPALLFKSEAIVHPDAIVQYIDVDECQLSYNPLQMALIWNTLATREVSLLEQALVERHALPAGTAWVNYVRSHDDIGWTFADEDAARLGIDAAGHRRFLSDFFTGEFAGSFARGLPFQENPRTGDSRVAGSTASLAGLEAGDPLAVARILAAHAVIMSTGGIPLLYLGDEVGQLNDYSYRDDPALAVDTRWAGRPWFPLDSYAQRGEATSSPGGVFHGMRRLIQVRRSTPEFAGNKLVGFDAKNPHVLGFLRPGSHSDVLVLINFADTAQQIAAEVLSGMNGDATELLSGRRHPHAAELLLAPMAVVWLRYEHSS